MLDSSRSAKSSERSTSAEYAPLSATQSNQHPATIAEATEPKDKEASISLPQDNAPVPESFASRITRRRTVHTDATNATHDTSGDGDRRRDSSRWSNIRRVASTLMVPDKKVGEAPTVSQSIRAIVCASCMWSFFFLEPTADDCWQYRSQHSSCFHTYFGKCLLAVR